MPYVLIRHKVSDYGKWKRTVTSAAAMRERSGETAFQVYRDSRAPNNLTVVCRWDTMAKMQRFVKSAELRRAMKEAGVIGKPIIQFFSKMEDLTV